MSDFIFLSKVIIMRIIYALVVIAVIFNPWFSLWQLIAPANTINLLDLETGWPFKLLAVLIALFAVILFMKTTGQSMGKFGISAMLLVLAVMAYIPFYMEWLPPTEVTILYMAYFFVFPVLLGFGLSTGYITRWLNGTLITKPIGGHDVAHHPAAVDPGATDVGGHHG